MKTILQIDWRQLVRGHNPFTNSVVAKKLSNLGLLLKSTRSEDSQEILCIKRYPNGPS